MRSSSKMAVVTVLIVTSAFAACDSRGIVEPSQATADASVAKARTFEDRKAAAARVGEWHNAGLEFVRIELKKHLRGRKASGKETELKIQELCDLYFVRTGQPGQCSVVSRGVKGRANVGATPDDIGPVTSLAKIAGGARFDYTPSSAAQGLLDQTVAVTDTYTELSGLRSSLDAIDAAAGQQLQGEDLDVVLAVSAVAYSSSVYWQTDGQAWADLAEDSIRNGGGEQPYDRLPIGGYVGSTSSSAASLLMPPSTPRFWFNWRTVGNGDVMGGIVGGIFGGPKGVAAGALGGSLYEAGMQVLARLQTT